MNKKNIKVFYIGAIIEKSKLLTGQYHHITYFLYKYKRNLREYSNQTKRLYITTFHKGSYNTIHLAYKRAMEYKYKTGGQFFVCQFPITLGKANFYKNDVYAGEAIRIRKVKYITS